MNQVHSPEDPDPACKLHTSASVVESVFGFKASVKTKIVISDNQAVKTQLEFSWTHKIGAMNVTGLVCCSLSTSLEIETHLCFSIILTLC